MVKQNKKALVQALSVIIGICIIPIIYYDIHICSVFSREAENVILNMSGCELYGIEIIDNDIFKTTTNDSNIVINGIDSVVENISLEIQDANVNSIKLQVYYDIGQGFSESSSQFYTIRNGQNILKFDGIEIKSLRFDPGSEQDVMFKVENIEINNKDYDFFSSSFLFEFSVLGYICFLCIKNSKWWICKYFIHMVLVYNYFAFYYMYRNAAFIHLIIYIMIILLFFTIDLFWGRSNDNEELF